MRWTYAELGSRVDAFAAGLLSLVLTNRYLVSRPIP